MSRAAVAGAVGFAGAAALVFALSSACGSGITDRPIPGRLEFDTFQAAELVLGQSTFTAVLANETGGPTSSTGLSAPHGKVALSDGILFASDKTNNRIVLYPFEGLSAPPSGNAATGVAGDTAATFNDGTPGTSALLVSDPYGIAVSGNTLAVAEYGNRRITFFSVPSATTVGPTAFRVLGPADFLTIGGQLCDTSDIDGPLDVSLAGGRVIVTDSDNHRIAIWNSVPPSDGDDANYFLGNAVCGSAAGSPVAFSFPEGVWSDGRKLVVVDAGHNRVLIWNTFPTSSTDPDLILGQPNLNDVGTDNGAWGMESPSGVASNGRLLAVTDRSNHRVMIWHEWPTESFQAPDVVLGQAALNLAHTAANDSDGDGATDSANARTFSLPSGLSLFGSRLFVSDSFNHRILVFRGRER